LSRIIPFALIFAMVLSLVVIAQLQKPQTAHAAWYNSGGTYWNYRSTITIDHTKVGSGGVTNYPVLLTEANMPAGLWTNAKSDGSDLRMTASDGTTEINFEKVIFTPATPKMELWFLASSLSSSTDTTFYLYYGNAGASAKATSWGQGVWSAGSFIGVWHKNNATTTTIADSTSNANTGTKKGVGEPVEATGQIGKAQSYDGGNDYVSMGNKAVLKPSFPFTVSTWVRFNSLPAAPPTVIIGSPDIGFSGVYAGYQVTVDSAGKISSQIGNNNGVPCNPDARRTAITNNSVISAGNWYNVAVVFNTINDQRIYVNGTQQNTTFSGTAVSLVYGSTNDLRFGEWVNKGCVTADVYLGGQIDEVNISSTARTTADALTEYANQLTPSTFYSAGAAQQRDSIAPSNPTVISGYSTSGKTTGLTTNGYYTYPTPYFEWPAAEAVGGAHDTGEVEASGVAGYYSYFGTSCGAGGANPQTTRGFLSDTGGGIHYSVDTSATATDLSTNGGIYCLRVKTKDNAGNISDASEVFTYNYDLNTPNAPAYIAANPAGYTTTNLFSFSWPAATDNATAPSSGIAGYQYERGAGSGDLWSATQVGTSVSGVTAYQDGENIFLVRSVDNAGNYSSTVQTTYYYSASAPKWSKPTDLTAIPAINDVNSFAFSWTAPVHPQAIVDYGYSINAYPTNLNLNWTGSSSTTLTAGPYATIQGENTFYIVAKDEGGNYALDADNVDSVVFNCQTAAPVTPALISVTDSSNRAINLWALTIKWDAGIGQDPNTFSHYSIERSTNGIDFTELATTTSNAYIDATGLDDTTTYYYRIRAVDNAGAVSAPSSVIARVPTGKYTSPPTIVSGPDVAVKASTATITWVSSRLATSSIRFGTDANNLSRSQIDPSAKTDHSFSITGLSPGTKYYYQTQVLDEYRDYSSESAYSIIYNFTTLAAPSLAKVMVSNITLTAANISFLTSVPANLSLNYGTSISYGNDIPETAGSYTTNHNVNLNGLTNDTKYHFNITGTDIDGNALSSDDYVFSTLPMPIISSIQSLPDFSGSAPVMVITWLTNVETSSSVRYAPISVSNSVALEENQSALTIAHKVILSNLTEGTQYGFVVSGVDQFGNEVKSDTNIFTMPADPTPPVISNLTIETSNVGLGKQDKAQIVVSWTTNKSATSMVEYAKGISGDQYTGNTTEDKGLVTKHLVIISDLTPSTPYHLHAVSVDKNGNSGHSGDNTTIPGQVRKSILQLILAALQNAFGWLSNLLF
jgi:hypothetical protein